MGYTSPVSSAIAGVSLTGGKIYDLSDTKTKSVEQVYEEIVYNNDEVIPNVDPHSAATSDMAKDVDFIKDILNSVEEKLNELQCDRIGTIIKNSSMFVPTLIRICDYSEELQKDKTLDEYENAVHDGIVNFIVENRDLMSSYDLEEEDQTVIVEIALDTLVDLAAGKTFDEIFIETQETTNTTLANDFCKSILKSGVENFCKSYGEEFVESATQRFLSSYSDEVIQLGQDVGTKAVENAPFFADMFANIFIGGFGDLLELGEKLGKFISKNRLKKLFGNVIVADLVNNVAAGCIPAAGTRNVPFVVQNLLSNVSKSGFKVQGRFASNVRSFLDSDGFLRKMFVPKDVTTTKQFAEKLAANTCTKAVACKAVGTGVTTFVVSSIVSFAFEFAETLIETQDPIESLKAGGKKIVEDLPKNLAVATGTAVGQLVGSLAGAAIGGALGGPVGAFIGEKVGSFLGSLVGCWFGGTIYNVCQAAETSGKKWYKPWTW